MEKLENFNEMDEYFFERNEQDAEFFDYLSDQNQFLDAIVDGEIWADFGDIDDLMDRYI